MDYQQINAQTIDRWVADGWEWGKPVTHEIFEAAKRGEWDVLLTPTKPVPHEWFGELRGKRVLGLASGGQQMPIFTALGAKCTVLDYSPKQLESERMVAEREGYDIENVRADMTKPLPFEDGSFDLIFHPVSNCYVREVLPIWRECFRVLSRGGVLLAGLDNGLVYAFNDEETALVNTLPFDPLANEEQLRILEAGDDGIQFSHTIEEQIGGQLAAGLRLTDVYGDTNGTGNLHEHNIYAYAEENSVKSIDEIVTYFGAPETVAESFIDPGQNGEIRQRTSLKRAFIAFVCIIAMLLGAFLTTTYVDSHRSNYGYVDNEVHERAAIEIPVFVIQ